MSLDSDAGNPGFAAMMRILKYESIPTCFSYLLYLAKKVFSLFIRYLFTHLCIFFSWCMSKLPKSDRWNQKIWLRKKKPLTLVTAISMAGIAFKEPQEQNSWPHVHRWTDVIQTFPSGWGNIILLWLRVKSQEKSAFTRMETVVKARSPLE